MKNLNKQVGNRIRSAREDMRLSQRDVAERLGLSHVGYGDIERGKNQVGLEYLFKLSSILSKPLTYFLGIDTDLAEDEAQLLHLYRQIENPTVRSLTLEMLKSQVDADKALRGE